MIKHHSQLGRQFPTLSKAQDTFCLGAMLCRVPWSTRLKWDVIVSFRFGTGKIWIMKKSLTWTLKCTGTVTLLIWLIWTKTSLVMEEMQKNEKANIANQQSANCGDDAFSNACSISHTHQRWGSACKIASRLFLNLFFHFWSSVEVSTDLLHEISFITYCCRFSKLEQMVERFSHFSIIQY